MRRCQGTTIPRTQAVVPGTGWLTTGATPIRGACSRGNELFAKLLEKLDVPESGGSTILDNSLVYWGNELGFNHIAYSVPCLLAGSAGGFIKTGRYLDYIDWDGRSYFSQEDGNVIKGIPHNRFLVTVLQAMGLSPEDYERDGKPGYGSTSVNGRDPDLWPTDWDLARVGEILPGITG